MHGLIEDIGLSIIVATIIGVITHRLKQPIIVGYLLAGIIIGPQIGPQLVHDPEHINIISEIGLVLLLFIIGLEMNPQHLMAGGRAILFAGLGQFPLTVLLGVLLFSAAGFAAGFIDAVYLAFACGLSSTAIVVKALFDKFELDSIPGRLTVGILIFQDVWAILVLALQPNLANPTLAPVLGAILRAVFLLGLGFVFSKYVLSRVFHWISRAPEMVVAVSIGWCAFFAALANQIGLSFEMGALIAGVSISSFPYSEHVTEKILPLRDFFLTLFFISLGMKIPYPQPGLLLTVPVLLGFVVLSRFLIVYPVALLGGSGKRTALIASLNLSQISEFSLVIASIGVARSHISSETMSAILYSLAVASVLSSYVLKYNHQLYGFIVRYAPFFSDSRESAETSSHAKKDICVLGFHKGARAFVDRIATMKPELLKGMIIVDYSVEVLKEVRDRYSVQILFGDISAADTLERAGVREANYIVSTIPDALLRGTTNQKIVRVCRSLSTEAFIAATADSRDQAEGLRTEGANQVLLPYVVAGERLAMELVGRHRN